MSALIEKGVVVYFSPAGTTQHVAQVMQNRLEKQGVKVTGVNLAGPIDNAQVISEIQETEGKACLFIGSPVYASRALPPVMDFISRLPKNLKGCAVPFVTWGGVTSGVALYEMAKALRDKGLDLIGAAKVLAVHSMMWQCEHPVAAGHPDTADDQRIEDLIDQICKKIDSEGVESLPLEALAYQPPERHEAMLQATFEMAKGKFPKRQVNQERCTQCGVCAEVCPVDAITLTPWPEFGDNCIYCFNCVRECPENAIEADLSGLAERIEARRQQMAEAFETRVFSV